MEKTYFQAVSEVSARLEEKGVEGFAAQFVLMERKGWEKTQWVLHLHESIPEEDYRQLLQDEAQLAKHVPPQYLVGSTEFFSRRFKVTKEVLIPRTETEELVQLVLENANRNAALNVVDIGVGSGAIAVSLALECPRWHVFGGDCSSRALEVAKENARYLGAEVRFFQGDVLTPLLKEQVCFDLIVSNPPYIAYSEWDLMDLSVRQYEPKQALFAEENGLAVYRKIAEQAPSLLKSSGMLGLEIGFSQGEVVSELMREAFCGRRDVELIQDSSGKSRIVFVKPEKRGGGF